MTVFKAVDTDMTPVYLNGEHVVDLREIGPDDLDSNDDPSICVELRTSFGGLYYSGAPLKAILQVVGSNVQGLRRDQVDAAGWWPPARIAPAGEPEPASATTEPEATPGAGVPPAETAPATAAPTAEDAAPKASTDELGS